MTNANENTTKRVRNLFGRGYAPSRIDQTLKLAVGAAHDTIVESWATGWEATATSADSEKVFNLLMHGKSPSQIDKLLRLVPGTAHDVIVESWAADSRRGKSSQSAAKALDLFGEYGCA